MSSLIIVADSEPDVLKSVCPALNAEGFDCRTATNGRKAWSLIRRNPPALAIIDAMLPGINGREICRAARREPRTAAVPLIILSGTAGEMDLAAAFEDGVDDYITKPFSSRELVLRVKAILRRVRTSRNLNCPLVLGDVSLDPANQTVAVSGVEMVLTSTEYNLLRYFLETPERVHSREKLMNKVWEGQRLDPRSVDTQVRRLRDRLGAAARQIETVRSFGYRMTQ